MKFRKKPVVISAVRHGGSTTSMVAIQEWMRTGAYTSPDIVTMDLRSFGIETLEGTMTVSIGDWVIKGVDGEFYPCKPEIFAKTYEVAE